MSTRCQHGSHMTPLVRPDGALHARGVPTCGDINHRCYQRSRCRGIIATFSVRSRVGFDQVARQRVSDLPSPSHESISANARPRVCALYCPSASQPAAQHRLAGDAAGAACEPSAFWIFPAKANFTRITGTCQRRT